MNNTHELEEKINKIVEDIFVLGVLCKPSSIDKYLTQDSKDKTKDLKNKHIQNIKSLIEAEVERRISEKNLKDGLEEYTSMLKENKLL